MDAADSGPGGSGAALESRVEELKAERDHFAREVADLRIQLARRGEDTASVVAYLKDDLERTKRREMGLSKELDETKQMIAKQQSDAESAVERRFEAKFSQQSSDHLAELSELRLTNASLKIELNDLQRFRSSKNELDSEVAALRAELVAKDQRHQEDIKQLERQFVDVRERILADNQMRITQVKSAIRQQVASEVEQDAHKVRAENARMEMDLQFHTDTSDTLAVQNDQMRQQIKKMSLELELAADKDAQFAKRGVKQAQLIRELSARVKQLERALSDALHDIEVERASWNKRHQAEVSAARLQATRAQNEADASAREIQRVQKGARALVRERTELETFFHQSLSQVRREIEAKRDEEYRRAKANYAQQVLAGRRKPSTASSATAPAAASRTAPVPPVPAGKVDVSELTPEDRERVLRLLFARINGAGDGRGAPVTRGPLPPTSPLAAAGQHPHEDAAAAAAEGGAGYEGRRGATFVTDMDASAGGPSSVR